VIVMEKKNLPVQPSEGVVYGEVAYWFLVAGVLIAIVGLAIYLATPGYIDKVGLLNYLWQGCDCQSIWADLSSASVPLPWYSHLGLLVKGDRLAMLGIAVACFAAVFGMWGTAIQMVRGKKKLYLIFAIIIAVVLTLSALGIVSVGD
jgi:hypothetical protein